MFLLVGLEIKSIYQDRNSHDREQREAREKQDREFKATSDGLKAAINGLNTAIKKSDDHFDATMARTNSVLTSITGGKSYAVVIPMLPHFNSDGSIPLGIENHGDKTLTGVTVTVYSEGIWVGFTHSSIMQSVNQR